MPGRTEENLQVEWPTLNHILSQLAGLFGYAQKFQMDFIISTRTEDRH